MYANTGGQVSKSTQISSSVKYDIAGKQIQKKNLGMIAMSYENCYVASISMGADYTQSIKAIQEAEEFDGPSLILCFAPCVDWGYDIKDLDRIQREAVNSGYWPLYRYNPSKETNKFIYDSKTIKSDLNQYLDIQNRFVKLKRENPKKAKVLQENLKNYIKNQNEMYRRLAMNELDLLEFLKKKYGEEVEQDKHTILYASETGNAKFASEMFEYELKRRGLRTKLVSMDDYPIEELQNEKMLYFIASTCGQGQYPNNSVNFMQYLSTTKDSLENVNFTIFGLGDDSYVYFNKTAKDIRSHLLRLGAKEINEIGLGNDKDEDKYETAFNEWAPEVFTQNNFPQPPDELMPSKFSVSIVDVNVEYEQWKPAGQKYIPLKINSLQSVEGYERDIRHYEFDITGQNLSYGLGDCISIYAHNQQDKVLKFMKDMDIPLNTVYQIQSTNNSKNPFREYMTASQLFTEVLDIFGKPSRRFYEFLGIIARDEKEKYEIKHLLTKDGQNDLKELVNETYTYADLILKYKSCSLSMDNILDFIPNIKPRLYSIASSQEMMGDKLQLCIIQDDWTTPKGKQQQGLCSTYLKNLKSEGTNISGNIVAGGVHIPETQKDPIIMVALGTGIAPMRAFIQERDFVKNQGEEVGPMVLYYGVRNSSNEYTYGDELKEYHSKGLLTHLRPAFSRDQSKKVYVQDKIKEDQELLVDWFLNKNAYFYICGPAGKVPEAVRKALIEAFVNYGKMNAKQADEFLTQLQIQGRYNLDVW